MKPQVIAALNNPGTTYTKGDTGLCVSNDYSEIAITKKSRNGWNVVEVKPTLLFLKDELNYSSFERDTEYMEFLIHWSEMIG